MPIQYRKIFRNFGIFIFIFMNNLIIAQVETPLRFFTCESLS